MKYLSKVRLRSAVVKTLRYEIRITNARIQACETELTRIYDMRKRAYKITWSRLLDHFQDLCTLKNTIEGCGVFWILTGRRLSFRCLWLTVRRLGRIIRRRNAVQDG
mgnify:CR=1 FL=1